MTCEPKALLAAAACYQCVPRQVWQSSAISLLCYWANHLTPQVEWSPSTSLGTWVAGGIPGFGDLTVFHTIDPTTVTSLDLSLAGITSITNLSAAPNLQILNIARNTLAGFTLDVSGNPALTYLDCHITNPADSMGPLDLSHNPLLTYVRCDRNSLMGTINLIGCTNLQTLWCTGCGLNNLDCSGNPGLITLLCAFNNLGTLNMTGDFAIVTFWAFSNPSLVVIGP